jgi:hypothetical protein
MKKLNRDCQSCSQDESHCEAIENVAIFQWKNGSWKLKSARRFTALNFRLTFATDVIEQLMEFATANLLIGPRE